MTTFVITNRQMRALALYEESHGCRVGGGSTEDALERYRKAEAWLDQMAAHDPALSNSQEKNNP